MRSGNRFLVFNHALNMHLDCSLHITLDLLKCITYCYTARKVRRISAKVLVSLLKNNKKTIHFISSFLVAGLA